MIHFFFVTETRLWVRFCPSATSWVREVRGGRRHRGCKQRLCHRVCHTSHILMCAKNYRGDLLVLVFCFFFPGCGFSPFLQPRFLVTTIPNNSWRSVRPVRSLEQTPSVCGTAGDPSRRATHTAPCPTPIPRDPPSRSSLLHPSLPPSLPLTVASCPA